MKVRERGKKRARNFGKIIRKAKTKSARVHLKNGKNPKNGTRNHGTLGQRLMKFAGRAAGLPSDLARNHDHYLYGAPRK